MLTEQSAFTYAVNCLKLMQKLSVLKLPQSPASDKSVCEREISKYVIEAAHGNRAIS